MAEKTGDGRGEHRVALDEPFEVGGDPGVDIAAPRLAGHFDPDRPGNGVRVDVGHVFEVDHVKVVGVEELGERGARGRIVPILNERSRQRPGVEFAAGGDLVTAQRFERVAIVGVGRVDSDVGHLAAEVGGHRSQGQRAFLDA